MEDPPKRATGQAGSMLGKTVADFATKTSKKLFTRLDLEDDFLKFTAEQWQQNEVCLRELSTYVVSVLLTIMQSVSCTGSVWVPGSPDEVLDEER